MPLPFARRLFKGYGNAATYHLIPLGRVSRKRPIEDTRNQVEQSLHPPLPLSEVEELRVQLRQKDETISQQAETILRKDESILRVEKLYKILGRAFRAAKAHSERSVTLRKLWRYSRALLRQYESLKEESEQTKRDLTDKCDAFERQIAIMNEEVDNQRKKKLEQEMASVMANASEANSRLSQAQHAQVQHQDPLTVPHHSLHEMDDGNFDPAREESIPTEEPGTGNVVDTVGSISNSNMSLLTGPKEESIDVPQVIPNDNQLYIPNFAWYDMDFKDEEMKFEMDGAALKVDDSLNDPISNNTISENHVSFHSINDVPMNFDSQTDRNENQQLNGQEKSIDNLIGEEGKTEEALKDNEVEKRKRSSKITSKSLESIESVWDSEDYSVDPVKKSNINKFCGKENRGAKQNDTEMECPQCEYRTRSIHTWIKHLRLKHSTTPCLAGIAFLCECGVECYSEKHSYTCEVANFTVIQKNKGNPQKCVLCEAYPKTALGYARHLRDTHKSTLRKNGIYLTCSCGIVFGSHHVGHSKKCDCLEYTLHKLGDMSESLENDKKGTGSTPRGGSSTGSAKNKEEKGAESRRVKRRRVASELSDSDESSPIALPTKKNAAAAYKTGEAEGNTERRKKNRLSDAKRGKEEQEEAKEKGNVDMDEEDM